MPICSERHRLAMRIPAFSQIDAGRQRRILLRSHFLTFYETHLSTKQTDAQTTVWFSRTDEDQGRTRHPQPPPSARPETLAAKGCRSPLRPAYRGLKESGFRVRHASG